ncbi:MAG: alpha,alpha-trehalose-phosphate synthase (UDP-forming) [Pseudomonadota bacterium]
MSRLVAVSNRVGPIRGPGRAGGLAVALLEALKSRGGLWFGWSGEVSASGEARVQHEQEGAISTATVDLSQSELDEYYNGFANRCLWPLFHFRTDLTTFDRRHHEGYRRVNRKLANLLTPLLKPDDHIWVHDYHLLPFAEALREHGASQPIGFFLHIPFPMTELLTTLPQHAQLMRGLFSYDLLGFQTEDDLLRFRDYVVRQAGGSVRGDLHTAYGRTLVAKSYPIGIDARELSKQAASPAVQREVSRMRATLNGRTQIIGVDRLDYTKGLPQRFQSMLRLLEDYPDTQGQVELLQIAPTSRGELEEYTAIRKELETLAGHINGRFAQLDWTPIRYINRAVNRRALTALYRSSRIGLVTPMRDGMNLVAKEYVAAQDPADPGVLVLSQFAGAARQMQAALLVNPYDAVAVSEAIQTARHMPLAERRQRHQELMKNLLSEDISHWREAFLHDLDATRKTPNSGRVHNPRMEQTPWIEAA